MLSVKPEQAETVLNQIWDAGVPAARIGTVGGSRFVLRVEGDQRTEGCTIDLSERPCMIVGRRLSLAR